MNEIEQPENWDQHCIVCQKSVDHGGGMVHFKVAGEMVALCCPLCIETFNKDSAARGGKYAQLFRADA